MSRTHEQLINIPLPKWPQMVVSGVPVTSEQAKEIIFRTDPFLSNTSHYSGGNDREFGKWYRETAGLSKYTTDKIEDLHAEWRFREAVRKHFGCVETEYVRSDWASCSYIGGPHGWCSPTGEIFYRDNIGKWPTVHDVLVDWTKIAEQFPFVDLHVTLMDNECFSEDRVPNPVVNIRVVNGKAELQEPDVSVHESTRPRRTIDDMIVSLSLGTRREIGLPMEWYQQFADRIRQFTDTYVPELDGE